MNKSTYLFFITKILFVKLCHLSFKSGNIVLYFSHKSKVKEEDMYLFRSELRNEVVSKFKIRYLANKIGIHEVQLSRILNNKSKTSKPVAYLFTKLIDSEKEINDFFIKVK